MRGKRKQNIAALLYRSACCHKGGVSLKLDFTKHSMTSNNMKNKGACFFYIRCIHIKSNVTQNFQKFQN